MTCVKLTNGRGLQFPFCDTNFRSTVELRHLPRSARTGQPATLFACPWRVTPSTFSATKDRQKKRRTGASFPSVLMHSYDHAPPLPAQAPFTYAHANQGFPCARCNCFFSTGIVLGAHQRHAHLEIIKNRSTWIEEERDRGDQRTHSAVHNIRNNQTYKELVEVALDDLNYPLGCAELADTKSYNRGQRRFRYLSSGE